MTYTLVPEDVTMGSLLWAEVVLLGFSAVVIPLVTPTIYVPLDPKVYTLFVSNVRGMGILKYHCS